MAARLSFLLEPAPAAPVSAATVAFAPPQIEDGDIEAVAAVLRSGWLTTGSRVRAFERAFASYVGAPHAVALNSCTAALHLSLLAAGIGPGDEVITTPLTFCATANTIVHAGATPVFADVDPATGNLDPAAVADAVTPRSRAIVAVHYAGRPAPVRALRDLARARQLTLVEDAAHAVEAVSDAGKVGSTADFTCFSFYATKNLTTGEGGMVTAGDGSRADWIRTASLHGLSRDAWDRYTPGGRPVYDVVMPGFKYNMPDLLAALGERQLERIERNLRRREEIWRRYESGLAGLPIGLPQPAGSGTRHARHLFTVSVDERSAGLTRDALHARLAARGIATSVHFRALHLHPYYATRFGLTPGHFPHAERISATTLSLPLSAAHTDPEIDAVIAAVRSAILEEGR
jgi:dTDP-4-amino-4,6-dideoxygalactose transaminase